MKLSVIAFTDRGAALAKRCCAALRGLGHIPDGFVYKGHEMPGLQPVSDLKSWCRGLWPQADGIIFIGATGIAVRTIAPLIQSKTTDPAVLVMGEDGKYLISLLSGHLGGGNALTRELAEALGAEPVITTATDLNHKFAVDLFAKKNGLRISSMPLAKAISAAILQGEKVGFTCTFPVSGEIPPELSPDRRERLNIHVGLGPVEGDTLLLTPTGLTVGIGCKRGTAAQDISRRLDPFLAGYGLTAENLDSAASIDLKKDEEGILGWSRATEIPINFYTKEELLAVPGRFSRSEFVENTTGVDCVCERAAVRRSGGPLLVLKSAEGGITLALAGKEGKIAF